MELVFQKSSEFSSCEKMQKSPIWFYVFQNSYVFMEFRFQESTKKSVIYLFTFFQNSYKCSWNLFQKNTRSLI